MKVCYQCLKAIESREGKQSTIEHQAGACDWCGSDICNPLYEILSTNYEKVTHCEKCKHYLSREEQCSEGQPEGYGYCREHCIYIKPDFYCGYGEPKGSAELKPCPFCGGEAKIKPTTIYTEKGLCVHCKDCNIHTTSTMYECKYNQFEGKKDVYITKEMAEEHVKKKWNRRVGNA